MTILITGVAGLMGSRLADWILKNTEHKVIGIDNLSGGYVENIPNGVKFYKLDLVTDTNDLKDIFKNNRIDTVYHLAAYAAEGLSPFIRKFNYETNVIASVNLINNSIQTGVRRFVFTSSMAVYGNSTLPPFSEDIIPSPIDPYGIAKYSVEMDLSVALKQHGLEYTIIRPHNFYGENQNIWDKYRNVLGIWMLQIINGRQPTIYGDGKQTRAFSYVDDSLEPMWRASQLDECKSQIINLGGIKSHSINEACDILRDVTGTKLTPTYLEARHEAKHAWSTWEKSERLLGFKHEIDLHEGLARMWKWAQTQPRRPIKKWEEYEIDRDIYSYWK
jgi:UDP-glucose 4-epimerase